MPTVRTPQVRPVSELHRGDRVGPYVVKGVIACGGMSVVYEVHHDDGTRRAFKVIDPELLRDKPAGYRRMLAARARREGKIQTELRHPNVVRVVDMIPHRSGPGLVMELVDGPTLHALVGQGPRLSWDEVDEIGEGFLSALSAAHEMRVVHRDIKPGNVLLERQDGRWVPKLCDFGLAKEPPGTFDDELTLTGQVMGTVGYMPPQQMACAKHVNPRVDVFAAGAVLFELVTGKPLAPHFQKADSETVALALRRLTARKDVPDRMREAVRLALGPDPTVMVGEVMAAWRDDGPVPVSRRRRVTRMVVRAVVWAGLVAAFLLA